MLTPHKIVNLTPHVVTLVLPGCTLRLASEGIARVSETVSHVETVSVNGNEIPVVKKAYGQVIGLPEPQEGTIYIVSLLVLQALPGRRDLFAPAELVRDESGVITGARALTRGG